MTAELGVLRNTLTASGLKKIDGLEEAVKSFKDDIEVLKGKMEAVAPLELVEKLEDQ